VYVAAADFPRCFVVLPKRLFSATKQIYGIWADDSGEEDYGSGGSRPSFCGAGGLSGKHNYSTPVSFVSGGVQQAGKQKAPKIIKAK
jgi:tuftelin-interacting protein 11